MPEERQTRRSMLRLLGAGGTAVFAAPLVVVGSRPADAYDPGREELRARYRADSPDVQAFYRTNRYES